MPYVLLTSNASMAFPEAVEACMRAGLGSLKWSVSACDEEQFVQIMGVTGRLFHHALESIRSAYEVRARAGHRTGLYASSIRYDGELEDGGPVVRARVAVRRSALLASALFDGGVRHRARGETRPSPDRRQSGSDRRPEGAASVLVRVYRRACHGRGDSLRLLLRQQTGRWAISPVSRRRRLELDCICPVA